jgi:AcrR family transcriptional regulator
MRYDQSVNRPKQHKPEVILAAAMSVFREEGVHVSTARIASAAGVSNGSLFNYFPTKQALIDALYISIKTDLAEAAGEFDATEPIDRRIRHVWDRWLGWARNNRDAHHVVNLLHQSGLASPEAQAAGNAAIAGPAQVLNDAQALGVFVDLPLEHIGALIQHHLDQAITSELDDRQADLAFHVLWNGITQKTQPARSTTP